MVPSEKRNVFAAFCRLAPDFNVLSCISTFLPFYPFILFILLFFVSLLRCLLQAPEPRKPGDAARGGDGRHGRGHREAIGR